MDFRRSGSADERRRRVLRDEITGQSDDGSEAAATIAIPSKKNSKRRYSDGALAENQPHITDFIPQRGFSLLAWSLLLLTAIAALEAVYISLAVRGWLSREPRLMLFDVAQRGSLAQWFAAGMMSCAAVYAYVTYRLRAYRVDDFRGRYRLWILAIAACVLVSIDVGTGAHGACSALAEVVSGSPFLGMRDGWWIAIYAGLFGALGLRLGIEIRADRTALGTMIFATVMFAAAGLSTTNVLPVKDPLDHAVLQSVTWLLGIWGITVSQAAFARHVYLDAQGLLAESGATGKPKTKRRTSKKSKSAAGDENSADEAGEPSDDSVVSKKMSDAKSDSYDDETDATEKHLSKSERRKLKKQQTGRRAA